MRKQWIVIAGVLVWSAAGLLACGDDTLAEGPEGGAPDASVMPDAEGFETGSFDGPPTFDAIVEAGVDAVASPPPRLLLSYNGTTSSELVAFGLQSKAVDGRLVYPGFIGTTYANPSNPWLLEQASDLVARLDPIHPWVVQSSWNVALNDESDAGFASPYSDPVAVVIGAGAKAYVLRYTRNLIAVIDSSQDVDAGIPLKTIDLSGQLQAAGDGYVEMTAGYFDANSSRVYVLLGNINRGDVSCDGYCQLCSDTSPTLVAIDTTTDTIVPLGGDAGASTGADAGDAGVASSGYVLPGYDPAFGQSPMVYDPTNNRLLVLETGCNLTGADGGAGALVRRQVDAVSLANGSTQVLLDLTSAAYPEAIFYIDAHHAILQLDTAYTWDPTTSVLGPAIPNAPDNFAIDGQGNLVGATEVYGADGGLTGISVVSVSSGDGGVTTLGQNPFSLTSGFVSGAELWPAP
jgi:hypothetical protein